MISDELLNAYIETNYFINNIEIPLKINKYSDFLNDIYNKYSVNSCAYITAYNPYSKQVDECENIKNNQSLKLLLEQNNYKYMEGFGNHPSNEWEKENSFLIIGIDYNNACVIGKKYNQNAILWCNKECVPNLIILIN
jgi:hypothetical protein